MKKLLLLIAVLLPLPLKLGIYRALGWKIGKNVRIGLSVLLANQVEIGDNVRIGSLNIIKSVQLLHIGADAFIANGNHFFGAVTNDPNVPALCELHIGEKVLFMSRHFVDVMGVVRIGAGTTVGGRDTQIWSHSLVFAAGVAPRLSPLDVTIGENCYIGARVTLVGCSIPDRSVVAAGSVVTKTFPREATPLLIAGNPGIIRKRYVDAVPVASQNAEREDVPPAPPPIIDVPTSGGV